MTDCRRSVTVLSLVAGLIAAGCSSQDKSVHQQRRQFTIVMKSKLGQFERRTRDLSVQVDVDSLSRLEVDSLEASYGIFRAHIDSISTTNMSQWNQVKPTLEAEYYDLERRYYQIAGDAATRAAERAAADTLHVPGMSDSSGMLLPAGDAVNAATSN